MSVKGIVVQPFAEGKRNNLSVDSENTADTADFFKMGKIKAQNLTLVLYSLPVLFDIESIPFLIHGDTVVNIASVKLLKAPVKRSFKIGYVIPLTVIFLAAERCELLTGINIVKAVAFLSELIFSREKLFENFRLMLFNRGKFRIIKIRNHFAQSFFAVFTLRKRI